MASNMSPVAQMMDKKVVDDYMSTWSDEKKASYEAMLEQCTTAEEKANVMKQYKYRDAYNYLSSQADLAIMGGEYLDAEGKYVWSEGLDNKISGCNNTIEKANGELDKINYGKKSLFEKNDYADLGHLEDVVDKNGKVKEVGVATKAEHAREDNMDDLADVYDEAKEKLIAARDEQTSIKDAATAEMEKYEAARKIENAKLAFSQAMLTGNEDMINESAKIWMQSEIDYYDKYESNNSIDTPEEGARALEINQFKTALGISVGSYAAETQAQTQTETQKPEETTETDASDTTSSSTDEQKEETAETSATGTETQTQTETVESTVETPEVKAGAEETTEQMSDKPNPYAFEKPPQPEGMPYSSYETMCKDMEAAHIKEVNAKVADEIWNEGKWGNGQERIDKLTAAGYDVAGVQAAVNEKIAKINETSAAKTAEAQTITAEKTETQASVESDSPETKTWTDDKGNKITDKYIGDKKFRTMECTDGKTWNIVYGEDGKRDAATCRDPKTGKTTNITYNEEGYKDVVQVNIDGKPVRDIKCDGTADERKVAEAKIDTKNHTIQELKYDEDGKVISEEIIDTTDRPGMEGQTWDEQEGAVVGQTWEEATAQDSEAETEASTGEPKKKKSTRQKLNPEKKESPPLKRKTKGVNPYLEEGEVDTFDATVDAPAFDSTVDVPAFNATVDEPKFNPKVDEPTFNDKIDEPTFDATVDEGTPKKKTNTKTTTKTKLSQLDSAAGMANGIGDKGKGTDYDMDAD